MPSDHMRFTLIGFTGGVAVVGIFVGIICMSPPDEPLWHVWPRLLAGWASGLLLGLTIGASQTRRA